MFEFGWKDASEEDAIELGLEQATRYKYQLFVICLFGFGVTLMARVKPNA